ncbi:hypothetical protein [Ruegeria sp. HKCCD8929]|uniref:hypothetical protein n=1 Tax=Ruegeria sp. HKCCD8929 TaxID=2683006 RepID=UPI00148765BE|nr:hypothetical protein [Ruegeria sp. HKCCD8929]
MTKRMKPASFRVWPGIGKASWQNLIKLFERPLPDLTLGDKVTGKTDRAVENRSDQEWQT